MIDAAWVLGGGNVAGDTGSGDYTDHVWVTGEGKGTTVTPAKGDTSKKLFFINAGERYPAGTRQHHGMYGYYLSATQSSATNAWRFYFDSNYPSGTMNSYNKLYVYSLRCVRS